MYVIDRLKQDFPEQLTTIEEYDKYLRRYHKEPDLYLIFDDQKPNYHWLNDAFAAGVGKACYNKFMALYQRSLNEDNEYLNFFIDDFFDYDAKDLTVEEKINFINEKFAERGVK